MPLLSNELRSLITCALNSRRVSRYVTRSLALQIMVGPKDTQPWDKIVSYRFKFFFLCFFFILFYIGLFSFITFKVLGLCNV